MGTDAPCAVVDATDIPPEKRGTPEAMALLEGSRECRHIIEQQCREAARLGTFPN